MLPGMQKKAYSYSFRPARLKDTPPAPGATESRLQASSGGGTGLMFGGIVLEEGEEKDSDEEQESEIDERAAVGQESGGRSERAGSEPFVGLLSQEQEWVMQLEKGSTGDDSDTRHLHEVKAAFSQEWAEHMRRQGCDATDATDETLAATSEALPHSSEFGSLVAVGQGLESGYEPAALNAAAGLTVKVFLEQCGYKVGSSDGDKATVREIFPPRRLVLMEGRVQARVVNAAGNDDSDGDDAQGKCTEELRHAINVHKRLRSKRMPFNIRIADVGVLCSAKFLKKVPSSRYQDGQLTESPEMLVPTSTGVFIEAYPEEDNFLNRRSEGDCSPSSSSGGCQLFVSIKKVRSLVAAQTDSDAAMQNLSRAIRTIRTRDKASGLYDCLSNALDAETEQSLCHLLMRSLEVRVFVQPPKIGEQISKNSVISKEGMETRHLSPSRLRWADISADDISNRLDIKGDIRLLV